MSVDRDALDSLRIERDEPEEPRGKRRRWLWTLIIAAGTLAILLWVVAGRDAVEVSVETAVRVGGGGSSGASTVLDANGYVVARRQATVSSEVTGRVTSVLVEEGMKVEQGELLATIDPENPAASLALARAQARAAASSLEETRVRLEEAKLERDRARRLAEEEVGTEQSLDRAAAEVAAFEARLARQRDEVEVARRRVELQQRSVEDTEIRAPFAGVVISKNAQEGEMISPISAGGGFTRTGICTIVDMSSLEIEVDVNEAYINRVEPGQRVEALLDAYPDWTIPAHVITVVPAADRQKATVRVRIAIDESDSRILPDMGVKVAFLSGEETSAEEAATSIPAAALRQDGARDFVWVLTEDEVTRRAVSVMRREGERVLLGGGVQPGERVVTSSEAELEEGMSVELKESER